MGSSPTTESQQCTPAVRAPHHHQIPASTFERFYIYSIAFLGKQSERPSPRPPKMASPVSLKRPPMRDPTCSQPAPAPPVRSLAALTPRTGSASRTGQSHLASQVVAAVLSPPPSPACFCQGGSLFYSVGVRKYMIRRWVSR